ncbi:MAG: indolepyruvate ferredoxin oxidoreductase, partial [Chloroflexi bacterium]|nr:indolepyruvate ferredoxin oxidoreductase [Chloroflexota bacterium]
SIEDTLRGMGISWVRRVNAYNVADAMHHLREALDDRGAKLRVLISDQECMLAQQRRKRQAQGNRRVNKERFGVDAEICTGDHSCMRLSGCPSLTLRDTVDPLKDGPPAFVDENCVACSLCGTAAHAARLCPSFYEAKRIANPGIGWRLRDQIGRQMLKLMGAS